MGGQSRRLLDEDDLRLSLGVDGELEKSEKRKDRKEKRSAPFLSLFLSGAPPILSFASTSIHEDAEMKRKVVRTYSFPFKLSFEQDRLRPRDDESSESDGAHSERSDLSSIPAEKESKKLARA